MTIPARRQHDGGRVRRRRARRWSTRPRTSGPTARSSASTSTAPSGSASSGARCWTRRARRCLLDTPEARAGLEWVYNTQAKFQLIDDFYRTPNIDAMFESAGHPGRRAARPRGWSPSTRSRARSGSSSTWGSPSSPGGPRGTARRPPGPGWGSPARTTRRRCGSGSRPSPTRRTGWPRCSAGPAAPAGRADSWVDPRLLALDPIYATMVKVFPRGAGSITWPANNRRLEFVKAIDENLTRYFRGQASLAEATTKATAGRQRRPGPLARPARAPACRTASVPAGLVDQVVQGPPVQVAPQVVREDVDPALAGERRRGPVVRRDEGVGRLPEGAVRRERLRAVGVQAGPGDPALLQRPQQRRVVGDAAAGEADVVGAVGFIARNSASPSIPASPACAAPSPPRSPSAPGSSCSRSRGQHLVHVGGRLRACAGCR